MLLSVLDRSRTRSGDPEGQALRDTLDRARHAEELGVHRFWVAEHHAVPGIASGSPAVLLAAIGQVTRRIRLGSGGVMLPQHQPLVVAEQFRMLEALYPGRVDLGVGRSLGFTGPVRNALRRQTASPEEFADEIGELLRFLGDAGEVTARPVTGPVPVHVLATGAGVELAARLGLPLVVGGPSVLGPELPETLARYRTTFQGTSPHVILSLDVFTAGDADRARTLALPEAWAMAMSRRDGEFPPLEPPERILARSWPDQVRRRVERHLAAVVTGTGAQVADRLNSLVEATGADEVMVSTSTYDTDALHELDSALAGEVVR